MLHKWEFILSLLLNYNYLKMERNKKKVFARFERRMRQKKINKMDLVRLTDISRTTLYRNFNGDTEMVLSTYLKICKVLDLDVVEIPKELHKPKYDYLKDYTTNCYEK